MGEPSKFGAKTIAGAAMLMLAALCATSASGQTTLAQPAANTDPPAETYFKRARYSNLQLSPDGKTMAALVPVNERKNLALIELDSRKVIGSTSMQDHDVSFYRWIGDRTIEIETADLSEASGFLYRFEHVLIDVEGKLVRDMDKVGRRRYAEILTVLDRAGDDLVIQTYDRDLSSLDAYRYNPRTGTKTLLTFETPGNVTGFVADHAGQVRIAFSVPKDGLKQSVWYRRTNEDKWRKIAENSALESGLNPLAFDFDDRMLYADAPNPNDERKRIALFMFDPESGSLGELVSTTTVDVRGLVFDRTKRKLVGVRDASPSGIKWLDPDWDRLQKSVDAVLPTDHNRLNWGQYDPQRLIVSTESETQTSIFYLFDRQNHKMEEAAVAYPWLTPELLVPRRFVRYRARDGLSIPAYLTMPKGSEGKQVPLIVDIHGGPYVGAARYGYDSEAQFFASRGYAVLQPDFRGTRGYGEAFYKAGWRQWGLAMQDDVTDGVDWLIKRGLVDADRVCLYGGSYGGYATLWGLEKEPDRFRCGVAIVAVSDLELLYDVTWSDMNSESTRNYLTRVIGDFDADREKLRQVSPLYHADRIKAPLLLAYGASDRRVPIVHGNKMRSALDKYNKPYEWVVYSNEAHGFNKDENRYDFYRRVDAFLAKNLAVRSAPTPKAATEASSAAKPQ